MPIYESYSMGFMLGSLGTGVALPSIYTLYPRGFKFKRELPDTNIFRLIVVSEGSYTD